MIIRNASTQKEERQEMRGGTGNIFIEHVIGKEEMCGGGRMYAKVIIPSGHSLGNHEHLKEREIYYILKGKAMVMDDDQPKTMAAGDVMITGDGHCHSIENVGEDDLELMALILFEKDHE